MNVLPPPAAPSAPTSTRAAGAPAGATTDAPAGETTDAPAGFERLLADKVAGSDDAGQGLRHGPATGEESPAEAEPGAVAAAVHAAIAGWRADPGDVALGTHLRGVLHGTVEQVTTPPDLPGEVPVGDGPSTAVPAPVPGEVPVLGGTPADAAPAAGPVEDAGLVEGAAPDVVPVASGDEQVVPAAPSGATDGAALSGRPVTDAVPTDAVPTVATPAGTTSQVPRAAAMVEASESAPADARVDGAARTAVTSASSPRHRVTEPAPTGDPVPTQAEPAADAAELLTNGRTETTAPTGRTSGPVATSAATLDRVLRAVEALEHAPPPRRLSLEVDGVQLTVAMQGDDVSVAVRHGADALAPGWQRDLAAALRGRGLGLAADTGTGTPSGRGGQAGEERPDGHPARRTAGHTTSRTPSTQAAEPAGLRL